MNKLKLLFKGLLGITSLERQNSELKLLYRKCEAELETLTSEIKDMERLDIDFSPYSRGQNTIILTGQYKGRGYVKFYDIPNSEFNYYVERLKDSHKHNLIRNIDAPPQFTGYFK